MYLFKIFANLFFRDALKTMHYFDLFFFFLLFFTSIYFLSSSASVYFSGPFFLEKNLIQVNSSISFSRVHILQKYIKGMKDLL